MKRRQFLQTTGAVVAGMMAKRAFAKAHAPAEANGTSGRLVLPMNRNWLYSRNAIPEARMKNFDDTRFERVVIPHSNVRLPWHSFDDKKYEFVSVYRRHFRLPPAAGGKRQRRASLGRALFFLQGRWIQGSFLFN